MKYLAILFSIYMTVLTMMPCQDKDERFANFKVNSSIQKTETDKSHNGEEICTPFCTCSCCSAGRDVVQAKIYSIIVNNVKSQYAYYRMPAIVERSLEIYQPPQIV